MTVTIPSGISAPGHRTGTRREWLEARLDLLAAEKELTRRADELARRRRELPWVRIEKDYRFQTEAGEKGLADLFGGRSQLIVYHFMYGPAYESGCPSCSAVADGFNGSVPHLQAHGVAFWAVSRAPLARLHAFRDRMGWSFPWASSSDTDFNFDFQASHTDAEWDSGAVAYNYRTLDLRTVAPLPLLDSIAEPTGTDWSGYRRESPGMSAFVRTDDGEVYHTYSTYERGVDGLWGMYQWLDRAPLGRNEADGPFWFRRHDEYPAAAVASLVDETAGDACCH